MMEYCVNKNAQSTGEHEVHKMTCDYLPEIGNRQPLGRFSNCREAVQAARQHFPNVDGCKHCSLECHTR